MTVESWPVLWRLNTAPLSDHVAISLIDGKRDDNMSFITRERLWNEQNARAKCEKQLFFVVEYANLWRSCRCLFVVAALIRVPKRCRLWYRGFRWKFFSILDASVCKLLKEEDCCEVKTTEPFAVTCLSSPINCTNQETVETASTSQERKESTHGSWHCSWLPNEEENHSSEIHNTLSKRNKGCSPFVRTGWLDQPVRKYI